MEILLWIGLLGLLVYVSVTLFQRYYEKTKLSFNPDTIALFRCKFFEGSDLFETNIVCQLDAKQSGLQILSLGYANKSMLIPYEKINSFEWTSKLANAANYAGIQPEIEYIVLRYSDDAIVSKLVFFVDDPYMKIYNKKASRRNNIFRYINMRIQNNR